MKSSRLLFALLTILFLNPLLYAQALRAERSADDAIEMTGLTPLPLDAVVPLEELDLLAAANIEADAIGAYRIAGPEDITVAAFREPSGARLLLYNFRDVHAQIFVRVSESPAGEPELRIWSDGPSEILITPLGMELVGKASADTFRFHAATNTLSVSDTISCLARALGISFSRATLESGLANASCSATNTITLVLTATNCLSIASIGSANIFATVGCINGIAKIIACGIARCSQCQLTPISFGRPVSGSWGEPCRSQRSPSSYAKFFTFTITRRTSVDVLGVSNNADAVLYLLQGGATTSPVIVSNDNGGGGLNARIQRTLDAGTYTIQLVSKGTERGGSFTLTLR